MKNNQYPRILCLILALMLSAFALSGFNIRLASHPTDTSVESTVSTVQSYIPAQQTEVRVIYVNKLQNLS